MKRYLHGPPLSGKTSRLAAQLISWLESGSRPDQILVLSASRAQNKRFRQALGAMQPGNGARGEPYVGTFYGVAQQHVGLFYPLIAEAAGFDDPRREPAFIDVETAQYFLDRIVEPRSADFDEFKLFRPRLLGQLLDNLHKAALAGFGLDEIAGRLGSAWDGDPRRLKAYQKAQEVAIEYRRFCLRHGALDFSLQHEVFARHLMPEPAYQRFIAGRFRRILIDNVDELPPIAHDFIRQLLTTCDEAILAEDDPGGFRLFLGADPGSARSLRSACDVVEAVAPPEGGRSLADFGRALSAQVGNTERTQTRQTGAPFAGRVTLLTVRNKYWVSMVQAAADKVIELVEMGMAGRDIAVVAPFVEDVLRFELEERLRGAGIRVRAVRPSRPLYDHPVTRALVTLARLGHPELASGDARPTSHELARALSIAIAGLDLARAKVLADFAQRAEPGRLPPIADAQLWERVGMRFRERYDALSRWLSSWRAAAPENQLAPLDVWWQMLFTEALSRPGFGFAADRDGANVADKLTRSARVFREALAATGVAPNESAAMDFVQLLSEGVMAAQYAPERVSDAEDDGVLLAPVYTYLTGDYRSQAQIWLDVNATGWYDRLFQPLTHPYVLSRRWQTMATRLPVAPNEGGAPIEAGVKWTEADEHAARQDMLRRVIAGLCARCGDRLFLASSQLGLSGQEEAGALARALQRAL